jgi:multiple sugar transport system ATP-binding protein
MAEVVLRNLSKTFKDVAAVSDINLEIKDGEFLVLVGPSGCGKTTVLRMIAGLEEPSEGEIFIDGRLVNDIEPKDRDIAMVFQNYALYPHMTVFKNMAFGLEQKRISREEINARVQNTAEMLGIQNLLNRKPKQLSGGQRQRVALGRAIVRKPKVFLMDEPLSNLDAKFRVQTRAELIKLHRQLGITTIYVTHDQVEAMTMGDRIVVMNNGVVQQVDTPLNLYNNPANMFVAGFIGSPAMNFVEARLEHRDGTIWAAADGFRLAVPEEKKPRIADVADENVILGIRPENIFDVRLSPTTKPGQGNTIMAAIDVVEPMGASATVYLKCGKDSLVAVVDSESPLVGANPGEKIELVVDTTRIHLFDPATRRSFKI